MGSLRKAKYLETEFTLRQLLRGPSVLLMMIFSALGVDVNSPPKLYERLNREKIQEKTLIQKNPTPR
jgi:hypothetical protein